MKINNKIKTSKFDYLLFIEIILSFYFMFLILEPLFFYPTTGHSFGYRTETKEYSTIHNSRIKGTYARKESITTYILEYTYIVKNKEYKSSHISNMIIYPEPNKTQGEIIVYYNCLFPSFSVISPVTFKYFILNNLLFLILLLLLVYRIMKLKFNNKLKKKIVKRKEI